MFFLLEVVGLFFHLFDQTLFSPRNAQTGPSRRSGPRRETASEFRMASTIAHSQKQMTGGVRKASFKVFATPVVVPNDELTFIQSSSRTRLLGRWLMRVWRIAEGRILLPGRAWEWVTGGWSPDSGERRAKALWWCDHKPNWPRGLHSVVERSEGSGWDIKEKKHHYIIDQ